MGPRTNCRFLSTVAKQQQRCAIGPRVLKTFRTGGTGPSQARMRDACSSQSAAVCGVPTERA
jgi:hypothetical protein